MGPASADMMSGGGLRVACYELEGLNHGGDPPCVSVAVAAFFGAALKEEQVVGDPVNTYLYWGGPLGSCTGLPVAPAVQVSGDGAPLEWTDGLFNVFVSVVAVAGNQEERAAFFQDCDHNPEPLS